ncbi:MAG: branched-chain amino acid ABC transporter permease, partial [Burkholderiaceae bacterium]|nr:branched-chain amino acid ABC transporter permease [Burkholderiaceae bacterium]
VSTLVIGGIFSLAGQSMGLPFFMAMTLSAAVTGFIALVLNATVFTRLLKAGPAIAMIGSLAVSMVILALILGIAGSRPMRFSFEITTPLIIGDARVSRAQFYSIIVSIVVLLSFAFLLFKTRIGRSMRALSTNRALAQATGVNAEQITALISFISGAFAAIGGTMLAMTSDVHVNLGNDLLLPVFAAAILGGLGNPLGAAAGALLIAVAETSVTNINFGWLVGEPFYFLPTSYIGAASFLILLMALLFKPYGLFDREVRRV